MRALIFVLVASAASAQPDASRSQLAALFAHGGKLYTPMANTSSRRCTAMRVTAHDFVFADWDGMYMTTSSWAYNWSAEEPDTVGIADPDTHSEVVPPDPDVWPVGSFGTLCAGDYKITYTRDRVEIGGQPLYFTLAAGRAALARPIEHATPDFIGSC